MRSIPMLLTLVVLILSGCERSTESPAEVVADPEGVIDAAPAFDFDTLVAEVTRSYFELIPEMATYYGVPAEIAGEGLSARLRSRDPAAEAARRAGFEALTNQLMAVDTDRLDERERTIHAVLLTQLESSLAPAAVANYGAVFADYGVWYLPYPVTQLSGPQISIPALLEKQHSVQNEADALAYLERLSAYGAAIDQVIETLEHDRRLGVVPPDFIIDKALGVIADRSEADPARHSLVTTLVTKLEKAGLADRGEFAARAQGLVRDVLLPANARLSAKLESLEADAGSDAGIWRLPGGEALYQAMIRHMTDTTRTPEEIHATGLAEVDRITAEMDTILRSEGYVDGSVGARMTALGGEARFLYPNTDAGKDRLIADLNAQMAEIEPLMPQWFGTIPEQKVVVARVPVYAEASATGGFYDAPALDGSRPGTYWINLRDTAIWPSYSLKTLTYHEANPGHHHQTAVGMGLDTPILQSVLYSNAFGEGWGLYSEALAREMGLYATDPYGDLGRLQDELHRAIRLVVDTGMHALKWSRADAITYMVETEGEHPDEAEAEIDRYVTWPGQALGYKIGMLQIQALRAQARDALGDAFDIRSFHDELLNDGGVPLQVLEDKVARWIAARENTSN